MERQEIRDSRGILLGWLEPQPNGDIRACDSRGVYCGMYQASSNSTLDDMGICRYRGNMVTALIVIR